MKFGLFAVGLVAADLVALEENYATRQQDACSKVKSSIPSISDASKASFMKAYQAYDGSGSEDDVINAARQVLSTSDVKKFFELPDSFGSGGLDEALVQCAVLTEATPQFLAEFASQGAAEQTLVDQLLGDTLLQRDMLVSGGARSGKYAEAMAIYSKLQQLTGKLSSSDLWDDRSQEQIVQRLAIATAVEHAVPRTFRFQSGNIDPVEEFTYFQESYKGGDLDPNFEILTSFDCRGIVGMVDSSIANLTWMRETQATFHPDHLVRDVTTRYMQAVHTDVPYQHPNWPEQRDYTTIPAAGGECGPRAWFGRFARWAYGLPTWGHQQPGHAAMSTWTPSGWKELLGRPWEYSYWEGRGGPDYYLETQAREFRLDFQQVLRGQWVALALGEKPVNPNWGVSANPKTYGQGDFWSALMLYLKKTIVADNGAAPVRPLGKSIVPTKIESLMNVWSEKRPTPVITTDKKGTITIPAAAISSKKGSISIMPRADSETDEQLLHGGGGWDVDNHAFEYEVSVNVAGTYYLVANFATWHQNLDLFLTTSTSSEETTIPVFWSHGHWKETQPVEIQLQKGKNVLHFSRRTDLSLAFKEFYLFKSEPDVPTPDPHDMPVPTPPPTPLSDYIIQPNRSSCEKDGLTELTAEQCEIACAFFGYKDTGARNRPQAWPGCFVLGSGPWKGNCNFNSNTQGDGSDVTQLAVCSRHAIMEFI